METEKIMENFTTKLEEFTSSNSKSLKEFAEKVDAVVGENTSLKEELKTVKESLVKFDEIDATFEKVTLVLEEMNKKFTEADDEDDKDKDKDDEKDTAEKLKKFKAMAKDLGYDISDKKKKESVEGEEAPAEETPAEETPAEEPEAPEVNTEESVKTDAVEDEDAEKKSLKETLNSEDGLGSLITKHNL